MKNIKQHLIFLYVLIALLALIGFVLAGCDDMQMQNVITDLPTGAPAGMVLIPAGEALLGAPIGTLTETGFQRGIAFKERNVFIDAFYIDTHEVTVSDFQLFVEATGYDGSWGYVKQEPDHPVYVRYVDAVAYAEWAGKRLPTSAEWEKAARGGLVGKLYPWGDQPPNDDLARHQGDQYRTDEVNGVVHVGSYPPNGYGLYDMAGNAAEWVQHDLEITWGTPTHGGSWLSGNSWFCRVYIREILPPGGHFNTVGFRCVKDVE